MVPLLQGGKGSHVFLTHPDMQILTCMLTCGLHTTAGFQSRVFVRGFELLRASLTLMEFDTPTNNLVCAAMLLF